MFLRPTSFLTHRADVIDQSITPTLVKCTLHHYSRMYSVCQGYFTSFLVIPLSPFQAYPYATLAAAADNKKRSQYYVAIPFPKDISLL